MSHAVLAKGRLKILHVFDIAGVGMNISAVLPVYESKVITRKRFNQFCFESDINVPGPAKLFKLAVYYYIKRFKPDVIHVHTLIDYLSFIRKHSNAYVVFHAHGTRLREYNGEIDADRVLVSTPDLLDYCKKATLLLNTVDRKKFFPKGKAQANTALFIRNDCCDRLDMATKYASDHDLELTVIDRIQGKHVLHADMPELLRKHAYFLEFKGFQYPVLSKTALEALACDRIVIHEDNFRVINPCDYDFNALDMKIKQVYSEIEAEIR